METYEIFWDDLTQEAQKRLAPIHNGNDDIPIVIIELEYPNLQDIDPNIVLIAEDIEYFDSENECIVDVYFNVEEEKFIVLNKNNRCIAEYSLTKGLDEFTEEDKREHLDFNLGAGNYKFDEEKVTLHDVFILSKYCKKL